MVLSLGRQFRHGRHCPVEAAQIVAVAVAEPERVPRTLPTAGDASVAGLEVGGIAQRAHCLFAGAFVAGARVEECVRRRPARRRAAEADARAATGLPRSPLLVDSPRAGKRTSPVGGADPAQESCRVLGPLRIDGCRRLVAEEILSRQGGRCLVDGARVVRDVLVEPGPPVPRRTVRIELVLQQPGPGKVACACVRGRVSGADLDQLVEQPDGPDDEPTELCAVQHGARARIDAERPRRVRRVSGRTWRASASPVATAARRKRRSPVSS